MGLNASLLTGASVLTAAEGAGDGGGAGTITEITSTGGSVLVTAPTGPIVNLETNLAPGALQQINQDKLSALLNSDRLNALCFMPMGGGNTSSWSASGNGTFFQDTPNDTDPTYAGLSAGGCFVQGTGTGTSSALGQNNAYIQTPNFAGRPAVLKYNDPSVKFGMLWIGNILSTVDANTVIYLGTTGVGVAAHGNIRIGAIGSISTTKFVLSIGANAGASIVSSVSIDVAEHEVKMWQDTVNFWFQVDNETPKSLSAIPLYPINGGTGSSNPLLLADKVAGAVNHVQATRLGLWMCEI